jgi:hypothetical protein
MRRRLRGAHFKSMLRSVSRAAWQVHTARGTWEASCNAVTAVLSTAGGESSAGNLDCKVESPHRLVPVLIGTGSKYAVRYHDLEEIVTMSKTK